MSSGHGNPTLNFLHYLHQSQGLHFTFRPFLYLFIAMNVAFLFLDPTQTYYNYRMVFLLSPFWLPSLLVSFAVSRWLSAQRIAWLANQDHILLEIRIPRDIAKTPFAMETVLSGLHLGPGESTWWKRHIEGRARPWFSLELVAHDGKVHFYVWTRVGFRRLVESHFYAQYPGIEIVEAVDYSRVVDPSHPPYDMWGCDFQYTKGIDALPMRTYQDFVTPTGAPLKPEEQVDPLAQIIETIGAIGPKEQFWIQIVFRIHKNQSGEKYDGGLTSDGKPNTVKQQALDQLNEFRKSTVRTTTVVDPVTGATRETESFPNPSRGVQLAMESVERKVSKPLFDVNLRAIYTAPGDAFHGPMVAQLLGIFKPFHSDMLNGFAVTRWMANFDDQPWQDIKGHHRAHIKHMMVEAYRRRSAFHEPYKLPYLVMSGEEIATLFHIPSSGIATPSVPRIGSKTTEAPSNLPT